MALQFLIPAAMGLGKAIWQNQQSDPTAGLQAEYKNQAKAAQMESMRDTGGADASSIRNAIANQIYGTQAAGVSRGRGGSPTTQAKVASLASMGAGQEIAAKNRGRDRSERLRKTAGDLRLKAAQLKAGFKSGQEKAITGSLVGGGIGALESYGADQQQQLQQENFMRLLESMGYGGAS